MPFMIGKEPIRRTLKYLQAGKLIFKDGIQIFSINYNTYGEPNKGIREFIFWHLDQIQYKNPEVQIITFKNLTPTPFVKCYYEDGKTMLIDVDSVSKDDLLTHLQKVVGKSSSDMSKKSNEVIMKDYPAYFGVNCLRTCICVVPGQIPCPGIVPLPYHMRGKYIRKQNKEENS